MMKRTQFMSPYIFFFFLGYGDRIFPQKCELWVELSPKAMRTRIQDPLQFFLLMGHSWSLKVTYFRVFKEVLYVRKIKYIFLKGCKFFLVTDEPFFPTLQLLPWKGRNCLFPIPLLNIDTHFFDKIMHSLSIQAIPEK